MLTRHQDISDATELAKYLRLLERERARVRTVLGIASFFGRCDDTPDFIRQHSLFSLLPVPPPPPTAAPPHAAEAPPKETPARVRVVRELVVALISSRDASAADGCHTGAGAWEDAQDTSFTLRRCHPRTLILRTLGPGVVTCGPPTHMHCGANALYVRVSWTLMHYAFSVAPKEFLALVRGAAVAAGLPWSARLGAPSYIVDPEHRQHPDENVRDRAGAHKGVLSVRFPVEPAAWESRALGGTSAAGELAPSLLLRGHPSRVHRTLKRRRTATPSAEICGDGGASGSGGGDGSASSGSSSSSSGVDAFALDAPPPPRGGVLRDRRWMGRFRVGDLSTLDAARRTRRSASFRRVTKRFARHRHAL